MKKAVSIILMIILSVSLFISPTFASGKPLKTTLSSVNVSDKGVVIKWKKVKGAEKYRVFRKNDGNKWKKIADTAKLTYTDKTAKEGKTYQYSIRCISKNGKKYTGDYAKSKSISLVKAPKISSISANQSSIKIKWGKVKNAVRYRVLRKTGSSEWNTICETASLSFTDNTAKENIEYKYSVRCVSKDGKQYTSKYSNQKKAVIKSSKNNPKYEITYKNYYLYQDSSGKVRDYAIVQVKNTGTTDLYVDVNSFDFEDENGHLVGTDSGLISCDPDIIKPGEYAYLYSNMGSPSGSQLQVNGNYNLVPNLTIKESKLSVVRYQIFDTSIEKGRFGPVNVIGRIKNNTKEDTSHVWISVIVFDKNDNPLGAFGTNIYDLPAGSTQSFDTDAIYLSSLDISLSDVARYEVYACKTQYQW